MKTQNIKGKMLSNQIATRNTKEKKAGQVELARKLDANVHVSKFRVLFAAYRARVQGPLNILVTSIRKCPTIESDLYTHVTYM